MVLAVGFSRLSSRQPGLGPIGGTDRQAGRTVHSQRQGPWDVRPRDDIGASEWIRALLILFFLSVLSFLPLFVISRDTSSALQKAFSALHNIGPISTCLLDK